MLGRLSIAKESAAVLQAGVGEAHEQAADDDDDDQGSDHVVLGRLQDKLLCDWQVAVLLLELLAFPGQVVAHGARIVDEAEANDALTFFSCLN